MKKIISLSILLIFSASCVSTTKLLLIPTEQNKKFLIDGRIALESNQSNSQVKLLLNNLPKYSESKDGKETHLWMNVKNLSKKNEFIFDPSKHIKITRQSDKSFAEVLSYRDLLDTQLSNEKLLKNLAIAQAVLGSTTPEDRITQRLDNDRMERKGKDRRVFLKELIKPTTLFPSSEVSGLIAFLPKKLPDDKIHDYSIEVIVGEDKHLFNLKQRKK